MRAGIATSDFHTESRIRWPWRPWCANSPPNVGEEVRVHPKGEEAGKAPLWVLAEPAGFLPNGRRHYCLRKDCQLGRDGPTVRCGAFSEAYCLSAQTSSASTRNAPQ